VIQPEAGRSKRNILNRKDFRSGLEHKVVYISDQQYPIEKADSEQVMNTVAALGAAGLDITLIIPRNWRNFGTPKFMRQQKLTHFYGVNNHFKMKEMVGFPFTRLRLEKYSHCFVAPLWAKYSGCHIVFTRNLLSAFLSLLLGLKIIFETYRHYTNRNSVIGKLLVKKSHDPAFLGIITHSTLSKESLLKLGIDGQKVAVIHNGFNPNLFDKRLTKQRARKLLQLSEQEKIACYSGRLDKEKGIESLITLAEKTPEITYLFIGKTQKDPPDWISQTARLKGLRNVRLIAWMQCRALTRYLIAADVLLIPPTSAPLTKFGKTVLPLKLFLYLAAGRPILAPALPDIADILNEKNAMIIEPDNSEDGSHAIRMLFSNKILADRLARSAKITSANFTWQKRGQKIIGFIQSHIG